MEKVGDGGGFRRALDVRAEATVSCCSACAGDYEDPDRSAWGTDDPEDEEHRDDQDVAVNAEE
ncbi:MAG: hypothetical protein NVS9B4_11390 [Candidatus Acidiferrum sp.]